MSGSLGMGRSAATPRSNRLIHSDDSSIMTVRRAQARGFLRGAGSVSGPPYIKKERDPFGVPPSYGLRPLTDYQLKRAPNRMTRGATSELIRLALLAFWVRRRDCTASLLNTLKPSTEKVILARLIFTALSA